ncbi:MAG: electron transport complex subunit RsxE [Sphaerochaetaceae bacterium]|nr:electron transport complex subunit RsxE [Spirochaetales bacterium]MDY3767988.1 electron transport complex subunit RsxE [Sphaerochaetaceae bacterium]
MFYEFKKGLIKDNPVFVLMLGLCPILSMSAKVDNALGMGVAVTFVLLCSNVIISLLRSFIRDTIRIPAFIVVIASFVTIVELVVKAFIPSLSVLGVYLPLITVNCIILGRAEAFASKNTVYKSALDGLGMGIGFTLALLLIAFIREILGSGSISLPGLKISIPILSSHPIQVLSLAPGALLVMGLLLALFSYIKDKKDERAIKQANDKEKAK